MSWSIVALQDVCSLITDGTHYTPPDAGEGIPFLTVKDVSGEGLDFLGCSKISEEEYRKADAGSSAPQVGDVLFSKDGTVGKVHVVSESKKFAVLSSLAILRPSSKLDSNYLGHIMRSPSVVRQASKNKTGSALRRIILGDIKKLTIPLPPLPEQKRITAILDKADAIRRKRQQAIQLADDFLRAVFLDMFGDPVMNPKGWDVKPVGELCDCIVPGRDKPKSFTGSTPWITTRELNHLGVTTKNEGFIGLSEEEIAEVKAKVVPTGSVLMTCVGDLGVVSIAGDDMVINQQLHAFLPSDSVTPSFLSYALAWKKEYMLKMASSTTVPYMNKTVCNSVPVILPPMKVQEEFEEIVKKITENKAVMAGFSSANLFESLSQRSFSGGH